ncbi:MAG: type IV pilin protein [Elusimicrobiaceae bacterium]|nr:prepilin-type N-terminal cleavage/methylation domain-containing protein [Elusimicrobiota bacterium]
MSKNKKGFTLLELLVVVLIIGILGAIALPQYMVSVERTRVTGNMSEIKPIYDAALQYYSYNDEFPDSLKKLPVSLPESYTVNGKTATNANGTCAVSLETAGTNPYLSMKCGRGSPNEYEFQFKYSINSSGTIFGAGKYFVVLAGGEERKATYEKVAKSSGWVKDSSGAYRIN